MSADALNARTATVLERAIARAQSGEIDAKAVIWTLAASEVVFVNETAPSGEEFPEQPVLVQREGLTLLAVYSHRDLAEQALQGPRVVVRAPAFEILRRVPAGVGIVVNPGSRVGFEVPADGLRAFVLDLVETSVEL